MQSLHGYSHFYYLLGLVQFCMWILFQPGDFGIKTSSMVSASMADWLVTKAQKSWIPNVDFQLPCGIASRRRLLCCWLVPAWMLRMLCCAMCWAPRKHSAVSESGRWHIEFVPLFLQLANSKSHLAMSALVQSIPWQPRLVFPICEGGCGFANSKIVANVGWCYLDDAKLSVKLCLFSNRDHQILQGMIDCAATPWSKWLHLARIHSWKGCNWHWMIWIEPVYLGMRIEGPDPLILCPGSNRGTLVSWCSRLFKADGLEYLAARKDNDSCCTGGNCMKLSQLWFRDRFNLSYWREETIAVVRSTQITGCITFTSRIWGKKVFKVRNMLDFSPAGLTSCTWLSVEKVQLSLVTCRVGCSDVRCSSKVPLWLFHFVVKGFMTHHWKIDLPFTSPVVGAQCQTCLAIFAIRLYCGAPTRTWRKEVATSDFCWGPWFNLTAHASILTINYGDSHVHCRLSCETTFCGNEGGHECFRFCPEDMSLPPKEEARECQLYEKQVLSEWSLLVFSL